jgi:hypothetical protein
MLRQMLVSLLSVLLASCGSESFTEIEKDRAPLIAGLESYASREEVMSKFPRDTEIKVVEDIARNKKDSQPPHRVYAVKLMSYEHLKKPGQLLLTFFNDRLMQIAFYPEKFDEFVAALRASGVDVKTGTELIVGHTTIWLGSDYDNKPYVGWADDRLRAQQRRWLSKYA